MKLSKRLTSSLGCLWLLAGNLLLVLQVVFLTLKLGGFVAWSWWATLIPIFSVFALPVAGVVLAVIVMVPKMLIAEIKRSIRVEARARKYGMERKAGESTTELQKRIIDRNMIAGNTPQKMIKDQILKVFTNLDSCQVIIDYKANDITLIPRRAEVINGITALTKAELRNIEVYAEHIIPKGYKITVKNAEEKYGEENHNKADS